MPIEEGDREPEVTARVVPNRRGAANLSVRGVVRGKTSVSLTLAQRLAQRADDRILITDVESLRPAGLPRDLPQKYTPIFVDSPPSSGFPVGGPAWEEAMRALGLPHGEDRTR